MAALVPEPRVDFPPSATEEDTPPRHKCPGQTRKRTRSVSVVLRVSDTNRCRLTMLTGEYDYSCTVEHSAAPAAKIPGVRFQAMPGIGHFPFAENPALFADYLLPILHDIGD